jgi:hypothetical protein
MTMPSWPSRLGQAPGEPDAAPHIGSKTANSGLARLVTQSAKRLVPRRGSGGSAVVLATLNILAHLSGSHGSRRSGSSARSGQPAMTGDHRRCHSRHACSVNETWAMPQDRRTPSSHSASARAGPSAAVTRARWWRAPSPRWPDVCTPRVGRRCGNAGAWSLAGAPADTGRAWTSVPRRLPTVTRPITGSAQSCCSSSGAAIATRRRSRRPSRSSGLWSGLRRERIRRADPATIRATNAED